ILGMTRAEILRRFDAIVEFAEISRFLDTPVKRYSSGMYVRLAFAVAAHLEPDILLVDEVLSVGDASFRRRSLGRMNDVAKGGRTVVFVSHDLGSVARLTTKCVYLANGGVAAYGPTDQVIRGYLADIREHRARGRRRDLIPFRRDSLVDAPIHVVDVGMHEDKESISLGDPLEIEITLRVTRTVEALTVTIIIRDEEGRAAAVIHSPDQNFTVSANRGDCTIRVDCADLALAPGAYHIDVGVNQGGGTQAFDVVRDVPLFEIVNTGQVVEWLERPWGVVHPRRVTWEQVDH
ncbi:MAG: ABC transporter ATP-binding protein, partial [Gammaproteobacteria bacterium]